MHNKYLLRKQEEAKQSKEKDYNEEEECQKASAFFTLDAVLVLI